MSRKTRRVVQYDLEGRILRNWPSISEAALANETHSAGIQQCCAGKFNSAGGYIWRYASFKTAVPSTVPRYTRRKPGRKKKEEEA